MKIFKGLVLILLIQSGAFAQALLPRSSSEATVVSTKDKIDRLNDLAFSIYLENPDSARVIAEKALIIAEKARYKAGAGRSFLNIGYVYWSQSYYPIALFYLKKALINLPADQPLLIADCYCISGRTYANLGDYKKAFDNLELSEHFAAGNTGRLAQVFAERSFVYKHLKDYERAITEASQALSLTRTEKDQKTMAILYGRLSDIYSKLEKYKNALVYADTAYKMSIQTRNNRLLALTLTQYATIYNQLHDFDKAISYAKKSAVLADSIGVVDASSVAYRALINSYEQKGDLKQAMAFQRKYSSIQDSLKTFDKTKNAELIQAYFTLNKRLNDIAATEHNAVLMRAKMRSQELIIITLAVSLSILVIMLWIAWFFYRQKQQVSERLNRQNEALIQQTRLIEAQTANLQNIGKIKDKLLAVIGHDLRAPLANLRNISEMFEVDYLTTEEVNWLMKDINPLIKSAELTLSNLMEWAGNHIKGRAINSSRLDLFLLGVEMEQTFNHALQRKNIEFINRASPGQSVLADENHIKVVLRNLISNAIKFTDANGFITLSSKYEESKVIISVEDNGKGMTADEISMLFFLQTHFSQPGTSGEKGTGIGLLLCKELVELNGGKLWISSSPGKGSKFFFSLPLNAEYA